jgi:putative PIN family toxin of toxin-antitoxin system
LHFRRIVSEYVEVLSREKFSRFPDFHARAQVLLADIEAHSMKFTPGTRVEVIADGPDNRLLELAEVCEADYLVTGNTNDFTMPEYKWTKIVSPREFFEIINR